jgi:peroxiredoxin
MTAPDPKRTTRQYSRLVGAAFLIFIVFVGIKVINSNKQGGTGLERGADAPKFAAPSATGSLEGLANIFQTSKDARASGRQDAACDVKERDAIRVCDYFDAPLVLVIWFKKCGNCVRQLNTIERVRRRFPKVHFLGVDAVSSVGDARKAVERNGWGFPMAVDEDGRVSAKYNVSAAPAIFFIYPRGRVMRTTIGELNEQILTDDVRALVKDSRAYTSKQ